MIRDSSGDLWTDALLLHSEERTAEARARAARRALVRAAPPPPGRLRRWLGAVLVAVGQRLLGVATGSPGRQPS
jgi:hypothetical protein